MRKRLLAFMLALALTVGSALPAFAEASALTAEETLGVTEPVPTDEETLPAEEGPADIDVTPAEDTDADMPIDFAGEEEPAEDAPEGEVPADAAPEADAEVPAEDVPVEDVPVVEETAAPETTEPAAAEPEQDAAVGDGASVVVEPAAAAEPLALGSADLPTAFGTIPAENGEQENVKFNSGADGNAAQVEVSFEDNVVTIKADLAQLKSYIATKSPDTENPHAWVPVVLTFTKGGEDVTAGMLSPASETAGSVDVVPAKDFVEGGADGDQVAVEWVAVDTMVLEDIVCSYKLQDTDDAVEVTYKFVSVTQSTLKVTAAAVADADKVETALPKEQKPDEVEPLKKNIGAVRNVKVEGPDEDGVYNVVITANLDEMTAYAAAENGGAEAKWVPLLLTVKTGEEGTVANTIDSDNNANSRNWGGNDDTLIFWPGLSKDLGEKIFTISDDKTGALLKFRISVKDTAIHLYLAQKPTGLNATFKDGDEEKANVQQNIDAVQVELDDAANTVTITGDMGKMAAYKSPVYDDGAGEDHAWVPVVILFEQDGTAPMDFTQKMTTPASTVYGIDVVPAKDYLGDALDRDVIAVEWVAVDTLTEEGSPVTYKTADNTESVTVTYKFVNTAEVNVSVDKVSPFEDLECLPLTELTSADNGVIEDLNGITERNAVRDNLQAVEKITKEDGVYKVAINYDNMVKFKTKDTTVGKDKTETVATWFPLLFTFVDGEGKPVAEKAVLKTLDGEAVADWENNCKAAVDYGAPENSALVEWFGSTQGSKNTAVHTYIYEVNGKEVTVKVQLVVNKDEPALKAEARKVAVEDVNEDVFTGETKVEGEYGMVKRNLTYVSDVESTYDPETMTLTVTVSGSAAGMDAYIANDNDRDHTDPHKWVPVLVKVLDEHNEPAADQLQDDTTVSAPDFGGENGADILLWVPFEKATSSAEIPWTGHDGKKLTVSVNTKDDELNPRELNMSAELPKADRDFPTMREKVLTEAETGIAPEKLQAQNEEQALQQNLRAVKSFQVSTSGDTTLISIKADLANMLYYKAKENVGTPSADTKAAWIPIVFSMTDELGNALTCKEHMFATGELPTRVTTVDQFGDYDPKYNFISWLGITGAGQCTMNFTDDANAGVKTSVRVTITSTSKRTLDVAAAKVTASKIKADVFGDRVEVKDGGQQDEFAVVKNNAGLVKTVETKTDDEGNTTITITGDFAKMKAYKANKADASMNDSYVKWMPVLFSYTAGNGEARNPDDEIDGVSLYTDDAKYFGGTAGVHSVEWLGLPAGKDAGTIEEVTFTDKLSGISKTVKVVFVKQGSKLSATVKLASGDLPTLSTEPMAADKYDAKIPFEGEMTEQRAVKANLEAVISLSKPVTKNGVTEYTLTYDPTKVVKYKASSYNEGTDMYPWLPILFSFKDARGKLSAEATATIENVFPGANNENLNDADKFGGTAGDWIEWIGLNLDDVTASGSHSWEFRDPATGAAHTVKITIKKHIKDIGAKSVKVNLAKSEAYTGKQFVFAGEGSILTIKDTSIEAEDQTLKVETDYKLSFEKDGAEVTEIKDAGTYTVVITGIGNYIGTSRTVKFTVKQANLKNIDTKLYTPAEGGATEVGESYPFEPAKGGAEPVDQVKVTLAGSTQELQLNRDYTIKYANNTKDKANAKVTVTGMGNYTGSVAKNFKVTAFPVEASKLDVEVVSPVYTGKKLSPAVTVTYRPNGIDKPGEEDIVLRKGVDYSLLYNNNINAAEDSADTPPTVTVTLRGGYSGKKDQAFTIMPIELEASIANLKAATDRNGNYKTLTPTVKFINKATRKNVSLKYSAKLVAQNKQDYDVHYQNDFNSVKDDVSEPGVYTASISIRNTNYIMAEGNSTADFVVGADLKTAKIKMPDTKNIVYDPLNPVKEFDLSEFELTVKKNKVDHELRYGIDYTIAYAGNDKAGKASVTFIALQDKNYNGSKGAGQVFYGSVTKTFTIKPFDLSKPDYDYNVKVTLQDEKLVYNGTKQTPAVQVMIDSGNTILGSVELKAAESSKVKNDFTVSYGRNQNVTTPAKPGTVTVKGAGNYKGTPKNLPTFTIEPLVLSGDSIKLEIADTLLTNKYKNTNPKLSVIYTGEDGKDHVIPSSNYKIDYTKMKRANWEFGGHVSVDGLVITPRGSNVTKEYTATEEKDKFYLGIPMTKVTVKGVATQEFDPNGGATLPLVVTYKVGKEVFTLREGVNYTVKYDGNDVKGKASVTLTAIKPEGANASGGISSTCFTGSVTKKFTVKAVDLKKANNAGRVKLGTYRYDDETQAYVFDPLPTQMGFKNTQVMFDEEKLHVYVDDVELVEGVDYTKSYKNNVKVSTAKSKASLVIKGKGNYSGSFSYSFSIVPATAE